MDGMRICCEDEWTPAKPKQAASSQADVPMTMEKALTYVDLSPQQAHAVITVGHPLHSPSPHSRPPARPLVLVCPVLCNFMHDAIRREVWQP